LPPPRFLSSCARYLPLAIGAREGGYVDLPAPRLIRGIGHPSAIRGKLCVPHRPFCLQQRLGYALRPGEVPQLVSLPEQYVLGVARPVPGSNLPIGAEIDHLFLRPTIIAVLAVQTEAEPAA